jgi:hypothetical protein
MQSPSPRGSEPDLGRMQQQETEISIPARWVRNLVAVEVLTAQ